MNAASSVTESTRTERRANPRQVNRLQVNQQRVNDQIERWLAEDLDAWTRRIVRRHFDPATGSPYWLARAAELSFDPRDITGYDELSAFGPFPLGELRTLDPERLVPADLPRPLAGKIWESGGTTGDPCRVYYSEPMLEHRAFWRRWVIEREGFESGRSWLQATPAGPHLIGHGAADLVELSGARVYGIDFDPRWVKRLLRGGKLREATQYTEHVVEQIAAILRSQHVDYLVTTPALLQAVARAEPELVARLAGARLSGTHVTPEMWRVFSKALSGGLLGIQYGNTFGNALTLNATQEPDLIPYVPNFPHITMSVVDPSDLARCVEYGDYGRVRLTVMHDDLFLPNVMERDRALRYDTGDRWPSDGVANVSPLQDLNAAPEGLY